MDFEHARGATHDSNTRTFFTENLCRVSRQQLDALVETAYPLFNVPAVLPPFDAERDGARFDVDLYRIVTYLADVPGAKEPIKISGLLAVPVGLSGDLPVVSWQHGTILSFDQVPSKMTCLPDQNYEMTDAGDSLETLFNVHRFAGQGYAVIAADYVGKGPYRDGRGEAFVVKDVSVRTCIAILEAGQAAMRDLGLGQSRLFLNGWSQGALNTLWLHQALRADGRAIAATAVASPFNDLNETYRFWSGVQTFPLPHGTVSYPPLPQWTSPCMILVLGSYELYYGLDGLIESAVRPEYREIARQFWTDYKISIDPGKLTPDSTDLRVTGFFEYFTDERNSAFIRQLGANCATYWEYDSPIRFHFGLADEVIHPAMVSRALSAGGKFAVGVPIPGGSHRGTFLAGLYGTPSTLSQFENIVTWFNTAQ